MKNLIRIVKVIVFVICFWVGPQGFAEVTPLNKGLQTAGWVENVILFPGNLKVRAKLDTGARNSSLNADDIDEFYRGGDKWVRFRLKNWKDRTVNFETKVIRTVRIKQHGKQSAMRPVIRLGICLGNIYKEVEVNLEDRSKFNFQLLIGRSFLKNSFLVDAKATFMLQPNCREMLDQ